VSETTHHDALNDEGFHEIQLSGKQLVFLFMAATVVLVFTFLCGVQIGRNIKGDRGAVADASDTVTSAAAPPPASTPTEAAPSSGPPAAEPPAPAQDDELSYAKRLQQADPAAREKLAAPAADTPAPKPAAPKSSASAAPAPNPPTQAASGSAGRPGAWIVQLSANKDRTQAASVARDLVAKGYPAFVLDPAPGAPAIYRVQVGGYPDRDKADQAARQLEKEEHFKPYVRSR
jgi:cell division septation protein DedD